MEGYGRLKKINVYLTCSALLVSFFLRLLFFFRFSNRFLHKHLSFFAKQLFSNTISLVLFHDNLLYVLDVNFTKHYITIFA